MTSKTVQEDYRALLKSSAFLEWKEKHCGAVLSHFFSQLGSNFTRKQEWDIGFYTKEDEKITVFSLDASGKFILKNVDEIFKKKMDVVEALEIDQVEIGFIEAIPKLQMALEEKFPSHKGLWGDGFIILQKLEGKIVWNCSFITKKLSMINVKLSVLDGGIVSSVEMNFLDKGKQ